MLVISRGTDDATWLIEHQVAGCVCLGGLAITTHIAEAGDYLIDIRSRETGDRPLKIVSDNTKVAVRYINTFAVSILVALFGLFQFYLRRRRKRLGAR